VLYADQQGYHIEKASFYRWIACFAALSGAPKDDTYASYLTDFPPERGLQRKSRKDEGE
jgi:hypothetical protein